MITDQMIEKIRKMNNPSIVGIDTSFDYLPPNVQAKCGDFKSAASAVLDFNLEIIDSVKSIVPVAKVQVAYYEMLGFEGMKVFDKTLCAARNAGMSVIADVKRNDIGATSEAYSRAYLSGVELSGSRMVGFESDFITLNGYLGVDGIKPFLNDLKEFDKGVFVLVKTSNPSSGQLQDLKFDDGKTLFEKMAALVNEWGADSVGEFGYSRVGAVVGATHPLQAESLRKQMPNTFFLVPGYGAQGGKADELHVCFDAHGGGAAVNSSRGILCAYRNEKMKGMSIGRAARIACEEMREDIVGALRRVGKNV